MRSVITIAVLTGSYRLSFPVMERPKMANRSKIIAGVFQATLTVFVINSYVTAIALSATHDDALAKALSATKADFKVPSDDDVAKARQQLNSAIAELERLLQRDPLAKNWKAYLRWDEMQDLLKAGSE